MTEKSNTYTVYSSDVGFTGGRYKSASPAGAAKKAASRIFRTTNKKTLTLVIRKTTQGSDKTLYKYKAEHIKLKKPIILTIKGKEIKYEYKTVVTALEISVHEPMGYYKTHRSMKGGGCTENMCSV